jgi:hypothetical protein
MMLTPSFWSKETPETSSKQTTSYRRAEFRFHERDHAEDHHVRVPIRHGARLQADAAEQEVLPLGGRELGAALVKRRQHVPLRQLDRAQGRDGERSAVLLLGDDGVVGEIDLGVEAARQHPFVVADQLAVDAHVLQLQAGQGGEVGVGAGVEAGRDDVDNLDRPGLLGAGLEEFFLAASDGPVAKLALDDLQALLNLVLVGAGAVTTEKELADVGGNRVLPREFAHEVFTDDVAIERTGCEPVQVIEFHCGSSPG